jgi:hypothetical protein
MEARSASLIPGPIFHRVAAWETSGLPPVTGEGSILRHWREVHVTVLSYLNGRVFRLDLPCNARHDTGERRSTNLSRRRKR